MKNKYIFTIIFSIIIFLIGTLFTNYNLLSFIGGHFNYSLAFAILFMWPFGVGLLLIPLVLVLLIISYRKRKQNQKVAVILFLISLFFSGVFMGGFSHISVEPSAVSYLRGLRKWVQSNIEIDSIQEWISCNADSWLENDDESEGFRYLDPDKPDTLPECFKGFAHQYIYLKYSDTDESRVVGFEWGGPFGHWGVIIGEPNMVMPKNMEEWYDPYDVEYRRIVEPGVYVYNRG
jgi:hypothetical protein